MSLTVPPAARKNVMQSRTAGVPVAVANCPRGRPRHRRGKPDRRQPCPPGFACPGPVARARPPARRSLCVARRHPRRLTAGQTPTARTPDQRPGRPLDPAHTLAASGAGHLRRRRGEACSMRARIAPTSTWQGRTRPESTIWPQADPGRRPRRIGKYNRRRRGAWLEAGRLSRWLRGLDPSGVSLPPPHALDRPPKATATRPAYPPGSGTAQGVHPASGTARRPAGVARRRPRSDRGCTASGSLGSPRAASGGASGRRRHDWNTSPSHHPTAPSRCTAGRWGTRTGTAEAPLPAGCTCLPLDTLCVICTLRRRRDLRQNALPAMPSHGDYSVPDTLCCVYIVSGSRAGIPAALTIATIPALRGSGSVGQDFASTAKRASFWQRQWQAQGSPLP